MKLKHKHAPIPKRLRGCKTGRKRMLTNEQIADIRRSYDEVEEASYNTLAKDYGVNPSTIRHVIQHLGAYENV